VHCRDAAPASQFSISPASCVKQRLSVASALQRNISDSLYVL
jgi:hypothetical protein